MPTNFDVDNADHFKEFFNLVCGDLLGEGIHRKVFEHRFDSSLVVKVEQTHGAFSNIIEWKNWDENELYRPVADWLAPCVGISPNGLILLQKRVTPFRRGDNLPLKLPSWMSDVKPQNFGWFEGRPVLCDYPFMRTSLNKKLVAVEWEW